MSSPVLMALPQKLFTKLQVNDIIGQGSSACRLHTSAHGCNLCRVGLIRPSVEVRFENLTAEASVHTSTSRNLPSVLNAYLNIAEVGAIEHQCEADPSCLSTQNLN